VRCMLLVKDCTQHTAGLFKMSTLLPSPRQLITSE
jgi:hypothetical protein